MSKKRPSGCLTCGLSTNAKVNGKQLLQTGKDCPVCEKPVKVGELPPGKKVYFKVKDARAAKRKAEGQPVGPTPGIEPRANVRSPDLEAYEWDNAA